MTKTTYKVGDKVRILDANGIINADVSNIQSGGIYEVIELYNGRDWDPMIKKPNGGKFGFLRNELKYIEKVEESDAKMTQFKVGDKVRIVNAKVISSPMAKINNGDIFEITGTDGGIKDMYQSRRVYDDAYLGINPGDVPHIELISPKPTKNQRISTLEQKVEAMQAEIDTLKAAQNPPVTVIADAIKRYNERTPNEQRKAIIDEAKAFVEATLAEVDQQKGWRTTSIPLYKKKGRLRVNFHVNKKKRTVVALAYYGNLYPHDKEVVAKGIAKCAPGDVFNADIGRAIALGRALGLDVERFEKAVQPSEVVVGHISDTAPGGGDWTAAVTKLGDSRAHDRYGKAFQHSHDSGWLGEKQIKVIDDTEAQY